MFFQELKDDVKALSSHVVNNCSMPDFDIAQKKNLLDRREVGLVFKLCFVTNNTGDSLRWFSNNVFEHMHVWPAAKMELPMIYDDTVGGVIHKLGVAINEFLMYFHPFNINPDRMYPL